MKAQKSSHSQTVVPRRPSIPDELIREEQWTALQPEGRNRLLDLATNLSSRRGASKESPMNKALAIEMA